MSLHLIELKIKTALELVQNIDDLNESDRNSSQIKIAFARDAIQHNIVSLRGVLREIINRPKEEGNNG